jgi:broad specificity phosphatase PhoE
VDLPANDPELGNHVSLLREIDIPSELQGLRFDDPRAREIQHAAVALADQPDRHYSDEENLYDLWRRAEEMRRYLETRTEPLIVVVAHGGINKVWLAHLMFTAVAGLDTIHPARLVGEHRSSLTSTQPEAGLAVAHDRHTALAARVLQLHAECTQGGRVRP